jgi:eukaryotic-like serine/threonine-protein kinase
VIDFGIAKAVNRGSEETRTGLLKGKLRYMAPEQATRGDIDRRADVWSMGAVFYGLMNGAPPFEESGDVQIIARLVRGIGPEPLSASVPAVVRAIIEKAMSVDREERYASTLEMAAALEAVMLSTAATASADDVAAFCHANAREAGDALPSSRPAERKVEPAPVVSTERRPSGRAAIIAGGTIALGAACAFLLLRTGATAAPMPKAPLPKEDAPLPSAVTSPTTSDASAVAPPSVSTASLPAPVNRSPFRPRQKPRQKR